MGLLSKLTKQKNKKNDPLRRINELNLLTEKEAEEYHASHICYDPAVCGAIHFFGEDGTRRVVLVRPDDKEEQYAEAVRMIKECGYYAVLATICIREVFPDGTVKGLEQSFLFNRYSPYARKYSSRINNHDGTSPENDVTTKYTASQSMIPRELNLIRLTVGFPE